jgi:hypothetical protein
MDLAYEGRAVVVIHGGGERPPFLNGAEGS